MPLRRTLLGTGYIYHIFSRGVNRVPIFKNKQDWERFLALVKYYKFKEAKVPFSHLTNLPPKRRERLLSELGLRQRLIDLIAYVLMPNHFHLVLRQEADEGIKVFMIRVLTGYSKYFNRRQKRSGPLFESRFKSVLVETDDQLLHVVRYVHLNPYSSLLVSSFGELSRYPHSSLREYLGEETNQSLCDDKGVIIDQFAGVKEFKHFTLNQVEYQRELEQIKHLTLE